MSISRRALMAAAAAVAATTILAPGTASAGTATVATVARSVNDAGTVVGYAADWRYAISATNPARPVLWRNNTATLLPTNGFANDVNSNDEVVGGPNYAGIGGLSALPGKAFVWRNGQVQTLSTPSDQHSTAFAINDSGVIAGVTYTIVKNAQQQDVVGSARAVIWVNGQRQELGSLGGTQTVATTINSAGQVAGYGTTASGETHAFLWSNGKIQDLGTLGGNRSVAYGINDLGQVVGSSYLVKSGRTYQRPVLWQNGKATDLDGSNYNAYNSIALSINKSSQVAGISGGSVLEAVRWSGGQKSFLGYHNGAPVTANDINSSGTIVGSRKTTAGYAQYPRANVWSNGTYSYLPVPALP